MRKLLLSLVVLASFGLTACGGGDDNNNNNNTTDVVEDNAVSCEAACADLECGMVGECECGTACETGFSCVANVCLDDSDPCVIACTDLECGDVDDADGNTCTCGTCGDGDTCGADNMCVPEGEVDCEAVCADADCGELDDGQGGTCACGTCDAGTECNPTTYVCECIPTCVDADSGDEFECGDDGCGGSCGTCDYGSCEANVCVCNPDCDGKDCGTDGCGGTCGTCEENFACNVDGVCVDACDVTAITFTGDLVQKVNYMDIGAGGHPGEALDVDSDPETCSPEGDCEAGLNNQLSGLLSQLSSFVDVTAELESALAGGSVILLAETYGYATDGTEFTVKFYLGEPVAALEDCDIQTAKCDYMVDPTSFDAISCDPIILFENAHMDGDVLYAGGPDNLFSVSIPITDGAVITVTAYMAQVQATVAGEGDAMTWTGGLIGGAIPKEKIMEAVDQLPPDVVDSLPVSIGMIKNLLDMFIQNDVDTDDDGELDAASVGIKFGTIAGTITGMVTAE